MLRNISHIAFVHTWVLYLIPVLLAVAALWWYYRAKRNYAALKMSSTGSMQGFGNPFKARLKKLLPVFRVLALAALLIALARPQTTFDEEKMTTEGIDIVLAADVSSSMLAKDFSPNRLEALKEQADEFINGRPLDRVGLVVFAGESFTQCPVTIDHLMLKKQLMQIKNGLLEDGTAIGMGLATSVQRLKESKAKSKVIILMTDGVNNKGLIDPSTACDLALQYGIRTYTIGIGTSGKAMTPVAMAPNGDFIFDYTDVQIDEALLKDIAKRTGGQYFRATDNKKLKEIYSQIDTLEKTKIEVSAYERRTEKFYVFALLAAEFLFAEILLRYLITKSIP